MSIAVLTISVGGIAIHSVNEFAEILREVLKGTPFNGSQRGFAEHVGIDPGLLSRVVNGEREPTPEFVGRICGVLPAAPAAELLQGFLKGVLAATGAAQARGKPAGPWKPVLGKVTATIECRPRRRAG
jgi:transcriptional regulator with XRE-family HTH domain